MTDGNLEPAKKKPYGKRSDSTNKAAKGRCDRLRVGNLEGYEEAEMRLERAPLLVPEEGSGTERVLALKRASFDAGVGFAAFHSAGRFEVHAFGHSRAVVRLIEWLGFLGHGGYRLALNARHDATFARFPIAKEVECATIMLPELMRDPSRGEPSWCREAYRALLFDRYGPGGTGTLVEAYDAGQFRLDPVTCLPVAA